MEIIRSEESLGAEIRGIDLRSIGADEFESIYSAWLDHQVLLFRRQQLTDDDLIAFSRRFGELDEAPIPETGRRLVAGLPGSWFGSTVIEDAEPIGSVGSGEASWHTDMS